MSTRTLDSDEMDDLEQAAADHGCDLRTDYDGRGMHGKTCIGLAADSVPDVVKALVQFAASDPDLASELLNSWSLDDMGKGVIVYFPGFTSERDDGCE
jgi:hypothetical protein